MVAYIRLRWWVREVKKASRALTRWRIIVELWAHNVMNMFIPLNYITYNNPDELYVMGLAIIMYY